jgi:hypothetical protein
MLESPGQTTTGNEVDPSCIACNWDVDRRPL